MANVKGAALIYTGALFITTIALATAWGASRYWQTVRSCALSPAIEKRQNEIWPSLPKGEGYTTAVPALKSQALSGAGGSLTAQSSGADNE